MRRRFEKSGGVLLKTTLFGRVLRPNSLDR
jgi:hypothetical protein